MHNWIETTFNVSEGIAQGLALVISLAVVLLLFGLFIFVIKRIMGANVSEGRNRQPRIAIMDSTTVDTRRRLLLVRRDNVEHLLLVGGTSDLVVEQNIIRHTPIAAGHIRSSGYSAQPAGNGAIKAPTAPGPDIPLTPEDMPVEHPGSALAAPDPAPPKPAPLPPATGGKAGPDPVPSQNTASKEASPKDRPSTASRTVSTISDAKIGSSRPAPEIKSTKPSSPEANLVQMAAKSGPLNTGEAARSQPAKDNSVKPSPLVSPSVVSAPKTAEVKPDTPPAAGAPLATGPSNPQKPVSGLGSLTKAFSPKDRPSYGFHSISPPASGPAARAKTVLNKPVESDPQTARTEPTLEPPTTSAKMSAGNGKAAAGSTHAATQVGPEQKAAANQAAAPGTAPAKVTAEASEEKPGTAVADTVAEAQTQMKPETPQQSGTKAAEIGNSATVETSTDEDAPKAGLGDRNPIEAEMAKILDEMGGQQKQ